MLDWHQRCKNTLAFPVICPLNAAQSSTPPYLQSRPTTHSLDWLLEAFLAYRHEAIVSVVDRRSGSPLNQEDIGCSNGWSGGGAKKKGGESDKGAKIGPGFFSSHCSGQIRSVDSRERHLLSLIFSWHLFLSLHSLLVAHSSHPMLRASCKHYTAPPGDADAPSN